MLLRCKLTPNHIISYLLSCVETSSQRLPISQYLRKHRFMLDISLRSTRCLTLNISYRLSGNTAKQLMAAPL